MDKVIERVKIKISNDPYVSWYHTDEMYREDLVKLQICLKERYKLDLTIEQCCTIWEKFSAAWDASFMDYGSHLVDTALVEYLNYKAN